MLLNEDKCFSFCLIYLRKSILGVTKCIVWALMRPIEKNKYLFLQHSFSESMWNQVHLLGLGVTSTPISSSKKPHVGVQSEI